jgi:DtxR family Mn-dependent transcriptional regulator
LAQWLRVSPPAVTKAMKRLRDDGYIDANHNGALKLTPKGREAAYRTALRHHLVERMLAEIFGMEWRHIHAEAERLEHVVSPTFEAKLIEKFGETGDCPHGNRVLPETPAQMKRRGLVALSEASENVDYVVASLYERDAQFLEFLYERGIGPHMSIEVTHRNRDNTLQVATATGQATLSLSAARKIWVRSRLSGEPARQ